MTLQHDFILLDRSGSMQGTMWLEAINSINAYVEKLAADGIDTGVTLVAFDSNEPSKILRDRITPKSWKKVTNDDAMPRGGTPLNDATGMMLDLAERGAPWGTKYDKVSIVIVTDGEENASQEYRGSEGAQKIKFRLNALRERGWQVTYLGANFDNQKQAATYGATLSGTVQTSAANFAGTMRAMAGKRGLYATGAGDMSWTAHEQSMAKSQTKTSLGDTPDTSDQTESA